MVTCCSRVGPAQSLAEEGLPGRPSFCAIAVCGSFVRIRAGGWGLGFGGWWLGLMGWGWGVANRSGRLHPCHGKPQLVSGTRRGRVVDGVEMAVGNGGGVPNSDYASSPASAASASAMEYLRPPHTRKPMHRREGQYGKKKI